MAQRATSLGPKPSLILFFVIFVFLFAFLSLLLIEKKTSCFPPIKAIFVVHFSVFPFVSL